MVKYLEKADLKRITEPYILFFRIKIEGKIIFALGTLLEKLHYDAFFRSYNNSHEVPPPKTKVKEEVSIILEKYILLLGNLGRGWGNFSQTS